MKLNKGLFLIGTLLILVLCVGVFTSIFSGKTEVQAAAMKQELSWKQNPQTIQSANSKIELNLPTNVTSENWIVGILPVKEGENETITAGIVRWQGESDTEKATNWKPLKITDYPQDSLSLTQGILTLGETTNLSKLSGDSIVILFRLAKNTEVRILQSGEEFSKQTFSNESLVISNGLIFDKVKVTGAASLIGQLQMRRSLAKFNGNPKEIKFNE